MAITLIEPYIVNSSANFTFARVNATSNLTVTGVSNLGPVGNVIITGGSNGQVLTTNGSGNLSWTTVAGGGANISNGNSNVNIATANGNITMSVAGNANVATVTGTGVNVSGTLNATGNITATNANLGNAATANFFIGNGSLLTGITTSGLSNGNSNVNIPAANGNVNISAAGNANVVVVTGTGANVSGTANVTGNIVGGGNLNIAGNAVIGGNLTVDGDLVYVNVTNLSVEDPIIQLQTGPNGAAPSSNTGKDVGTALNYYDTSAKIAWMGWDVSNAEIAFGSNVGIASEVVTFTSLANIRSGNAQLGNLATANFISGTLTTASQPNITSIGTLSSLSITGNLSSGNANLGNAARANFFIGDGSLLTNIPIGTSLSNGNSNVSIPAANGNINLSVSGNANVVVVTGTGINVAGSGTFTGNVTAGNFIAGAGSGGNLSGANVISANTGNFSTALNVTGVSNLGPIGNVIITGGSNGQVLTTNGSGNLSWTSITTNSISNGNSNVSIPAANGNINLSSAGNANVVVVTGTGVNVAGTGNFSGNLSAANLTVGSGTGGNISGVNVFVANTANFSTALNVAGVSNLGPVANVIITGGSNGQVLTTNGSGNLSWTSISTSGVSNGNSNVNIPAANGNVNISAAGNANILVVTGTGVNVAGTLNATGNANVGNLGATGVTATTLAGSLTTAAQPNITSIGTLSSLAVTGNITAGNANLGNAASANFFIGDGGLLTNLSVTTSGISNGSSNVRIPSANGNVVISVAGNSNILTVTGTGANVAGTFDITSNLTVGGKSNLGAVGNVIITGGSANYILQTDGSGNLSWAAFPILTSTVDNFTGNGVQTTFTLSVTPTSKNYTTVSYNGALLIRDSYSLSGANIVFTAAPANGANIEVTTLSGTGTTIGGSSTQVQYNNNGQLAGSSTFTFDAGNTRLTANNLAVSNIFTANRVGSDLIPNANITYDLGTNTNRWRDIWLSNSTIHLGNVSISATEGTVVLPEGTKVGNTSVPLTTIDLLDVNSNISPEVFTINVDFPFAGHGDDWFWTWDAGTVSYSRLKITNQAQATVPLYKSGVYTVNNFAAHELHGNMNQTHKIYLKWINGAGLENLVPWANSTLNVAGVSHPDINGGANTEVQRLIINVPQNITMPVLTPPNVTYNVSFTTSGAYTFMGTQMGNNPNIGPLYRGGTYTFNLANSLSGHPFYLTTDNGGNFVSNTFVGEYTNGVTGSRNQSGTLVFTVPNNAPNTLFYQCGIHSHMRGQITIKDLAVETNNDGNLILYFQHTQEGHFTPVEIRNKPTLNDVSSACLIFDGVTKKFEIKDMGQYIDETTQFRTKVENLIASETSDKPTNAEVTAKIRDETLFSSTLHQRGNLEVLIGTARWYAPFNLQITNIMPRLATASNGNVAVAINKNGSSTRTFTFAPNATTANVANSIINMNSGDYLTVDVTSVGNVAPGQDMYVQFTYKKV